MAPSGDMPTRRSQAQSLSLANMVPQVRASNAGVWQGIESAAGELALSEASFMSYRARPSSRAISSALAVS